MEEKILAMLKTKATAFGFSETELSEAAKTIASFINNAEATDEEITSKVDLMLPVLGLSQKAANNLQAGVLAGIGFPVVLVFSVLYIRKKYR